ncbi:serine/threonine-protein kinase [Streptomyces sp. NPDC021354]|uniref:serine/threonine-protein kinase n=1 Tax=Streptomyces sp. NPDC021354 TaxID=3154793 RepID=UPI003400ECB7
MTTHPFENVTHVASLGPVLDRLGTVFRTFDEQDSGCVSYGLLASGQRWFVKTSSTRKGISSLRRAVSFHQRVSHPAIVPLVHSFTTGDGLVLVHPWMSGEVLYHPTLSRRGGRAAPGSPMARFRAQPLARIHTALDSLLSAHLAVEEAGFVAVDLYDGCMFYDFDEHRMMLCDMDEYRAGPFVLEADRLPGSTRYMAPEEFVRGAVIDIRTTVFAGPGAPSAPGRRRPGEAVARDGRATGGRRDGDLRRPGAPLPLGPVPRRGLAIGRTPPRVGPASAVT